MTYAHQRLEDKIRREPKKNGCWIWTGARGGDGTGRIMIGSRTNGSRKSESARVFSYRFYVGPVADGSIIFSTCGVRECVNPHHLKNGNRSEMVREAVRRGTWTQRNSLVGYASKPGEKNPNHKLSDQQVFEIRESLAWGAQPKNLAKAYGISEGHVSAIKLNKVRIQNGKQSSMS